MNNLTKALLESFDRLFEDPTIEDKKDQIARAKKYIEENPDDPDNGELYELIDRLEKEISGDDESAYDLDVMLDQARDIVRSILPDSLHVNLSDENRPTIEWGDIKGNTLGVCDYENPSHITISNYLKQSSEDNVMNTVIHELIHAMPICRYSGHKGNFKAIADKISRETKYKISTYASDDEYSEYQTTKRSDKSYYLVTCNKCGREQTYYKKAGLIVNPKRYRCKRCKASDYKIEYHPKVGTVEVLVPSTAELPERRLL